jgi:hypothetical protein
VKELCKSQEWFDANISMCRNKKTWLLEGIAAGGGNSGGAALPTDGSGGSSSTAT